MKQPIFVMERWQSHHENKVEFNLAESGVQPITLAELQDMAGVDPVDTLLGYGHTDGSPMLRERIAAMYPGAGAPNVVATVGSAEANFLAMWRLVEPGDRVVVVRPTYEQTTGLAAGLGAHVESVWLEEDRGWQPAVGAAAAAIQPGTRVVVVTNPNNPTAHALGEAAIAEIVEAAERVGAWILSDEVYVPLQGVWPSRPEAGLAAGAARIPGRAVGPEGLHDHRPVTAMRPPRGGRPGAGGSGRIAGEGTGDPA
jgi:aspartate/methionine/tyrosine aminotransferase